MTTTIIRSLPSRFARAQIELTVADRDYTRALTWGARGATDAARVEPARERYEAAKVAFAAVSAEYAEAVKADRAG
jgi:hypothetical protein